MDGLEYQCAVLRRVADRTNFVHAEADRHAPVPADTAEAWAQPGEAASNTGKRDGPARLSSYGEGHQSSGNRRRRARRRSTRPLPKIPGRLHLPAEPDISGGQL